MNSVNTNPSNQIWKQIDKEKKRDRFIRRVSRISWGVTLVALVIVLITFGIELNHTKKLYDKGVIAQSAIWEGIYNIVKLIGIFGFIIAIISTVGTFLRLRTTSLLEIQQRLANLEQMVISSNKPEGQ